MRNKDYTPFILISICKLESSNQIINNTYCKCNNAFFKSLSNNAWGRLVEPNHVALDEKCKSVVFEFHTSFVFIIIMNSPKQVKFHCIVLYGRAKLRRKAWNSGILYQFHIIRNFLLNLYTPFSKSIALTNICLIEGHYGLMC